MDNNEANITRPERKQKKPLHEEALYLYSNNESIKAFILNFNTRYPDKKFKKTWHTFLIILKLLMDKGYVHLRTKVFEGRPVDKMFIAMLSAMIISDEFVERDLMDMQMIISRNTDRSIPWEILAPYASFAINAYHHRLG